MSNSFNPDGMQGEPPWPGEPVHGFSDTTNLRAKRIAHGFLAGRAILDSHGDECELLAQGYLKLRHALQVIADMEPPESAARRTAEDALGLDLLGVTP